MAEGGCELVVTEIIASLRSRFNESVLDVAEPVPNQIYVTLPKEATRPAVEHLLKEFGTRFLITVATDKLQQSGGFEVLHIFAHDQSKLFLSLRTKVNSDKPSLDALTPVIPGAGWAEREYRDVMGIEPVGHPDPRRLVLPDDWPEGVYPLRKDFPADYKPPSVERDRALLAPPPGASVMPIGPFFPVLEEPAYFRVFVEGETIVGCDYRGFYSHRGIEKLGDQVLNYNEIPFIAQRICGICGMIHSTCYVEAVERAAGIQAPPRALFIRSLLLELERIHSHLLWLGIAAHIIGFDTVLMQSWRIREPVMWLCEQITGNRKTYDLNLIGGVRRDVPKDIHQKILDVVGTIARQSKELVDTIPGDGSLMPRVKGVGILTNEVAKQFCVVGPTARASGVDIDARRDHPYSAYDQIELMVPTYPQGDVLARVLVRMDELFESIRLVRRLLKKMPEGPIMTTVTEEIPAGREGMCTVEAPRGEAIHYVLTGESNRPERWRVRAPTYPNLQAIPAMIQGVEIADVPITIGSIDPCFSCTERVEVIQARSGETRIYTQEELLQISRDKRR